MTYVKQTWQDNNPSYPVSAARLGHIEDGLDAVANGGSLPAVRYRITTADGVNVIAYDQTGATVYSGTDAGAAVTACLPAASSVGATIDFRNDGQVFPWSTTPALPKGITRKLLIRGNGATVQLSASAPRFLDPNRTADGDTFQNIEITDFVLDANSVGGRHHIVLGAWVAGSWLANVQWDNIAIRRVRVINAVTGTDANTDFRIGISLSCGSTSVASTSNITNVVVEDYVQLGGLMGIDIGGHPTDASTTVNVFIDNIRVNRWRVVRASAPVAFSNGSDVIVGSKGSGGTVTISNGYGYGSPDVGIEIDGMGIANISDVTIEDAWTTGFYHTPFKVPQTADPSVHTYTRCHAKRTSVTNSSNGWRFSAINSNQPMSQRLRDCSSISTCASIDTPPAALFSTAQLKLDVDGFKCDVTGWTWAASQSLLTWRPLADLALAVSLTSTVSLRNLRLVISGVRDTGGGTNGLVTEMLRISGQANVVVDDYTISSTITNGTATGMKLIAISANCGSTGLNLDARNVRVLLISGDTTPHGLRVGNVATGIKVNQALRCSGWDLSAGPSGTVFVSYQTAGDNNTKTFVRGNSWRTTPVPTTLTGLSTATGKQILTDWDAMVTFTQGSGTSITAIDYSTNGGTTYTNFLTQASGALPAGFDQSLGPLPTDALLKVTFTGTQPTINLVPVNP